MNSIVRLNFDPLKMNLEEVYGPDSFRRRYVIPEHGSIKRATEREGPLWRNGILKFTKVKRGLKELIIFFICKS